MIVKIARDHNQIRGRGLQCKEGLKDRNVIGRGEVDTPQTDSVSAPTCNNLKSTAGV